MGNIVVFAQTIGKYGKYSSICPNYRENMGNIVVFAQTIGRIWEI